MQRKLNQRYCFLKLVNLQTSPKTICRNILCTFHSLLYALCTPKCHEIWPCTYRILYVRWFSHQSRHQPAGLLCWRPVWNFRGCLWIAVDSQFAGWDWEWSFEIFVFLVDITLCADLIIKFIFVIYKKVVFNRVSCLYSIWNNLLFSDRAYASFAFNAFNCSKFKCNLARQLDGRDKSEFLTSNAGCMSSMPLAGSPALLLNI